MKEAESRKDSAQLHSNVGRLESERGDGVTAAAARRRATDRATVLRGREAGVNRRADSLADAAEGEGQILVVHDGLLNSWGVGGQSPTVATQ